MLTICIHTYATISTRWSSSYFPLLTAVLCRRSTKEKIRARNIWTYTHARTMTDTVTERTAFRILHCQTVSNNSNSQLHRFLNTHKTPATALCPPLHCCWLNRSKSRLQKITTFIYCITKCTTMQRSHAEI